MSGVVDRQGTVLMRVIVHGEPVELVWADGELSGDPELLARVRRTADQRRVALTDPAAAVSCVESALGMRPALALRD